MTNRSSQHGVTLVELMVAMALGLVLVLAASTAFIASKKLFNTDTEVQAAQDSLRFARYLVQTLVRQAGYADYAPDHLTNGVGVIASNANLLASSLDPMDLNIAGASNTVVAGNSFGLSGSDPTGGNDSLMVRFFGRSKAVSEEADGSMIDCMGTGRKGPSPTPSASDRALSILFVKVASDGEPSLFCKTDSITNPQRLVRGVEKFKVVYGYDGNGDSVPEAWLDAVAVAAKASEAGRVNDEWRKVVAVRVGIVVRSHLPNGDLKRGDGEDYRLFPLGSEFESISFKPPDDGRFRSVATFTVMLRNTVKDPV